MDNLAALVYAIPYPALNGYHTVTGFPNCLGAIDGKHIRVKKPPNSGTSFFNYKKYFSVVLMAVADADSNDIAIDVGSYGSTSDSRGLDNSGFGKKKLAQHNTLHIFICAFVNILCDMPSPAGLSDS